jgi:endo-alpha-1,4-polygalactosaminidase (GH114 family)
MSLPVSSLNNWWRPHVGLTWQWQLSEPPVDTSIEADVYDIEVFDNDASVVADLHAKGRKVIGYINVGSWEDWRPDRDRFPSDVLGKDYEGWPGEKWLDIRRLDLLAPIMRARMDLCQVKGFDAVEPDNMDIHGADSGFPITYQDQLKYVLWLAEEAHRRGLAIGIKNAADQVPDLIDHFDFAIIEDYFFYGIEERMLPLIEAGKPVFAAEYDDTGVDFPAACQKAGKLGISAIQKHRILTSYRIACE